MQPAAERDFDDFVAARYNLLRRTALVLSGDRGHAEDLTQIAFLHLYRAWPRLSGITDLDAYLHRVLINASRSWRRRRWHGERPSAVLPERATPHDGPAHVDLRDALSRALGTLPRGQREVLAMRYLACLTEAETARALGIELGTVKSRCSRALAALRVSGLLDDDAGALRPDRPRDPGVQR